jgi:hypothetical protein
MKKAVLVGINYLSEPSARLNGCINDINNISNVLTTYYGYSPSNIIKLTDDSTNPSLKPTASNILSNLTNLINGSQGCSEIWFHYSGHGSQVRDMNRDEMDGLDEVIVPMDFKTSGLISDDIIYNIIKNTKCKTMLIFDSCHSGSICDLQFGFEFLPNGQYSRSQINNNKCTNPSVISISGCKDQQTSADAYDSSIKTYIGAFTQTFITCLSKNNYNANLLKIYSDTVISLKASGFTQIPILSCSSLIPIFNFVNKSTVKSNINMNSVISGAKKEILTQSRKPTMNMVFV